ncbi:hypothetical protein EFW17_19545 [Halostreptopolyspora alba]|uniref:Uncharacterized protein n=1 Tax=Halostreptopolyspora alba TaxID=2487137 RepID=A0A3N0E397_9ACTN|nr:hypothetical protein EFW17_19545 [Nocardiopsaceae bacterium YIM 96095]
MVVAALAAMTVGAAPGSATDPSPAEEIATQLQQSPVYVDPTYESALPAEKQRELARRIEDNGLALYVLAVPMVEGGTWNGDPEQLIGAVHEHLGTDRGYLAVSSYDSVVGVTPGAQGAPAREAAFAVEEEHDSAPLATRFDRAVALVDNGEAVDAYERTLAEREDSWWWNNGSALPPLSVVVVAAGVVLLVLLGGGYLFYRRRPPTLAPAVSFTNADEARYDALRSEVERELVRVGERLGEPPSSDQDTQTLAHYQRALDAHHAAGRVLDGATTLADLAGVRVLVHTAEDELRASQYRREGRKPPAPRRHCYFNPLHPTETKRIVWRELGSSRTMRVHACVECAKAVRDYHAPVSLPVRHEGRQVPYYEVPADESVWSATGYGNLSDDMVQRVLRGRAREG